MPDEPRKPGRPRKPEPVATPGPMPPGPIQLEIRVDGKIKFLQRVYSYQIDQQTDRAVITGVLRPARVEVETSTE